MSRLEKPSLYNELAAIPVYTSAQIIPGDDQAYTTIRIQSSINDHVRNIKRSLVQTATISSNRHGSDKIRRTAAHDLSDAVASVASPSGKLVATLRDVLTGDGRKRFVEVWGADVLIAHKDVSKSHGEFYTDDIFASLAFSPSENAFVYTAETNNPEPEDPSYEKYRFMPHMGEKLMGKKRPALFLVRWISNSSATSSATKVLALRPRINGGSTNVAFGQAVFSSDDLLFATGYEHTADGRSLGVVGCFNRRSGIWMLRLPLDKIDNETMLECAAKTLTSPDRSCRSPRIFHHAGKTTLIWLSNEIGGPHHSCARLHSYDLETEAQKILVESVLEPDDDSRKFPGLYVDQLPTNPVLKLWGSPYIVMHSVWSSRNVVVFVSVKYGTVTRLNPLSHQSLPIGEPGGQVAHEIPFTELPPFSPPSNLGNPGDLDSWTVLTTGESSIYPDIVCAVSSPGRPNSLFIARIDLEWNGPFATWRSIIEPELPLHVEDLLRTLSCSVISIPNRHPVETIVVRPTMHDAVSTSVELMPCITMPHGGPHVATLTAFSPYVAALALEGYTISLPNYTGSLGYGERYVKKLIGNCGSLDVQDCMASARHLIATGIAKEGPRFQFVHGGSHGGFLGAHLIGQYPEFFTAAVLRNPVISAGELASTSDIPDWCYAEFGLGYTPTTILTRESFHIMQNASPITHVNAIVAPVLLLMGEQDQRVSPWQGKNFYHALKGRGRTVEMIWFPGKGHGLDQVEPQRLSFEATRDWFQRYSAKT